MASRADYFARAEDTRGGVRFECSCGDVLRLMLHHDGKTAPGVRVEPSGRAVAVVANAWPLPAGPLEVGGSCPGVTDACRDCYAAGLEAWAPAFRRGAAANLEALEHLYRCGGVRLVASALEQVVRSSVDAQRARGVRRPVFRWHSGGDFFSTWYVSAVARAIDATSSGVEHWAYTRTLSAVRRLSKVAGLSLYVSVDRYNLRRAAAVAERHGVPVAVLADDPVEAARLWGRLTLEAPGLFSARGGSVVCPATGKYVDDGVDAPAHVVGADGRRSSARRGAAGVGACLACRVCLPSGSRRHVTFLVHGGRARGASAGRLGAAVSVRRRALEAVTS